ncbi:MAG TPA: polyprenyl synthetase family protein, partial [Anaerohalosphaeraceae bacterium]|nr:polyprenyl synthetase family protein [Anaerohalosphaeraceae bacterium]
AGPVNLSQLGQKVRDWFDADTLRAVFNEADGPAAALALAWMAEDGKRYRPMLTAGIYAVLTGTAVEQIPPAVKQAAIAVECFHKASLIHDDIEDNDAMRYNQPTLHQRYGIPSALNAGDYLLGKGYQLLTDLNCQDAQRMRILQIAAQGHRTLCIGQGKELDCVWAKTAPGRQKLLEIFLQKTSPAFAVALKIGAVLGGADEPLLKVLDAYSDAVGIAYQIRDDLYDHLAGQAGQPLSILSALQLEGQAKADIEARKMLAEFRKTAVECLEPIVQSDCKAFLCKVAAKLLDGTELMECCDEYLSDAS